MVPFSLADRSTKEATRRTPSDSRLIASTPPAGLTATPSSPEGSLSGMAVAASWKRGLRRQAMLHYALMFLIVGLIAGALGLFGVAQVASQIAWVLFLIGIIFVVIHVVSGRRASLP